MEKWVGKSLRKDEALDITAVDQVIFKKILSLIYID
jgi:hypothetical protein